jgi:hypothetical protein
MAGRDNRLGIVLRMYSSWIVYYKIFRLGKRVHCNYSVNKQISSTYKHDSEYILLHTVVCEMNNERRTPTIEFSFTRTEDLKFSFTRTEDLKFSFTRT